MWGTLPPSAMLTPRRVPGPALSPAFCPLYMLPGWPQNDSRVTNDINDRVSHTLTGRVVRTRSQNQSVHCLCFFLPVILKNNYFDFMVFILSIIAGVDPHFFI